MHFWREGVNDVRDSFIITYSGEYSTVGVPEECDGIVDVQMSQCRKEWDCKCQDVANNTYYCVRKINTQDNSIICHFDDDDNFIEAYDLNLDPYQLNNLVYGEVENEIIHHEKILESLHKIKSVIKDTPMDNGYSDSKFMNKSLLQYLKDAWVNFIKYFIT